MESVLPILLIGMALAWVKPANDNVKGAATLVGSGLCGVRLAIGMATAATALGGLASLVIARGLIATFSGKGLVPDELAGTTTLLIPVGLGAAATVGLATWRGLPVSTTHALIGALIGAGLVATPGQVQAGSALGGFVLPLLLVPLAAIVLALAAIPLARAVRSRCERLPDACACLTPDIGTAGSTVVSRVSLRWGTATEADCRPVEEKAIVRLSPVRALDAAHVLSALAVSFARGLNDTPKIAAIALAGAAPGTAGPVIVLAMALGGLLAARRVADTLAWRVTRMDPAEGLGGNLVTSGLVLAASGLALPVSTTHVSGGALFGIAAGNRSGTRRTIVAVAIAWGLTLPAGALLGALFYPLANGVLT